MKEFVINTNDSGQRLDKYLQKCLPILPQSLMNKYIRLKRVKINGKKSETSYRLQEGDILQLYINDEFFEKPNADRAFLKIEPQLRIVYEDSHILLCDKQPGMVVHEDESESFDTLINHIKAYLYRKGEWDFEHENSFAPALCNRIDRNTGGIVIAAKTAAALRIMNDKIKHREITKLYLCLVHGCPSPKNGSLTHYIERDMGDKRVIAHDRPSGDAKIARLNYTTIETRGSASLVRCELLTGRTHQIRAQMAKVGHPLLGDTKYGTAVQNKSNPFQFQALYSYKLIFDFQTGSGELEYLRGKQFEASEIFFMDYFNSL